MSGQVGRNCEEEAELARMYEMTTQYLQEQGLSDQVDVIHTEGALPWI